MSRQRWGIVRPQSLLLVAAGILCGACKQRLGDASTPSAPSAETSAAPTPDAITRCLAPTGTKTVFPDAPSYERERLGFNLRIQVHPGVIVQPVGITQVQAAVRCARSLGLSMAVRSGGHSYEGYSLGKDGGMIIDLAGMTDLAIDTDEKTATVGAGWRLGPLYYTVWQKAHLAFAAGICPSVGLAGHSLGGGYGLIARKFGLASDNIVSLTIVDAEGKVLTANSASNPDLYWALRGGGGSFGVVVSFTIQLHEVPATVAVFRYRWPPEATKAAMAAYQQWAQTLPPEANATMVVSRSRGVTVNGLYLGSSAAAAAAAAPLLARVPGAKPLLVEDMPFIESVLYYAGLPRTDPAVMSPERLVIEPVWFKAKSVFLSTPLSEEGIDTVVEALAGTGLGPDLIFDAYGGAVSAIAPDATAFVHRKEPFSVQIYLEGDANTDSKEAMAWMQAFGEKLRPYVSRSAVPNYIDADLKGWQAAYYGANFARLVAVKKTYDPQDVFHFPQSIPTHYP
jgi:FAD/FMN-containing dehydrogenase